jgi:hypothetical protein
MLSGITSFGDALLRVAVEVQELDGGHELGRELAAVGRQGEPNGVIGSAG